MDTENRKAGNRKDIPASPPPAASREIGQERRVERALRRRDDPAAVARFADMLAQCKTLSPIRNEQWLDALIRLERWQDAEPVLGRLLASPPSGSRPRALLARKAGLVLLHVGRAHEAERWLAEALARGLRDCRLHVMLAEAARARQSGALAAARLEQAFACGGRRDPSLLLAAATWYLEAGRAEDARRLLQQAAGFAELSADQAGQMRYLERRLAGEAVPASEGATPVRARPPL